MLFFAFQLTALLTLFVAIAAFCKPAFARATVAFFGAVFLAFQFMAVAIGGALIDYKFYAHFKLDVATNVGGFFESQVGLVLVVLVLASWLIYWLGSRLNRRQRPWLSGLLFLIGLGSMMVPSGIISNISEISNFHFAEQKAFDDAIEQAGFNNYTPKEKIQAKAGKNIIAIFMESLEIGYLQDNLSHLTPNINRLRKGEMNFYPMTQNGGGNYTIGALYSYMTGIPMNFKNHGNDVFEEVVDFRLSSVPTVLEKAGYHQEYLAGKPEFAGMDVMFNTMGVEVKSEYNFDPKYNVRPWGLHDRDLFEIVDFELDRLYANEQPFAYFVSTISTHATDGVQDIRVDQAYPKQASRLELMALALDEYIGKLVDKLQAQGRLENTAIYILPDHLLLSSHSRVLDDFYDPRGLFLLTNVESKRFENGETINQIHMPSIILDGAGVKHNFTTLADQLPDDPTPFLEEHKVDLLQLNEAALTRQERKTGNELITKLGEQFELKEDEVRMISRGWSGENNGKPSYVFIGREMLKVGRGLNFISEQDGEFSNEQFDTFSDSSKVSAIIEKMVAAKKDNSRFWVLAHVSVGKHLKANEAALKALGLPKLANLKGKRAYLAYHEGGYISEEWNWKTQEETFPKEGFRNQRTNDEIASDAKDPTKWIAHAGGDFDGIGYPNFQEALDHNYSKGFRYFELDILETSDGHFVAAHDWKHWKNRARYEGDIPVSLAIFMENPPLEKYTPMDMKAINEWFAKHPDAVLITDKINKPKQFAEQFIDKSRLMMELFSFTAIEEAANLGIKEILMNEVLASELGGDIPKALSEKGVGGMSVSVKSVARQPDLYRALKASGIKVYAYHIGGHGLKDEAFMARYGLDLVYGLYADEWSLQ